jgi:hypothetical protein
MELLRIASTPPTGLAFEISDLVLLQGWAKFHDIRMVVELDHWVEGEEYEEVVAFYSKDSSLRRGILWRSAKEIIVQPLIGRSCRFGSVAGALDSMFKTGRTVRDVAHLHRRRQQSRAVRQGLLRRRAAPRARERPASAAHRLPKHRLQCHKKRRRFKFQVRV